MKTSIKSIHSRKVTLLLRTLCACLVVLALSFAAIPTRAGDAEDKARKAKEAVDAAKKDVKDKTDELERVEAIRNGLMKDEYESGKNKKKKKKKKTPKDEEALANANAEVAKAQAALAQAQEALFVARLALEKAINELPDGDFKEQLKKERNQPALVNANGLYTVKFDTPSGQLTVHLPNDGRAGDTISGTVIAEPKGKTEEERNRNSGLLNGYVVEIGHKKFPVNGITIGPLDLAPLDTGGINPGDATTVNSFFDVFVAVDINSTPLRRERVPLSPSGAVITPDPKLTPTFVIPPLGQTGRPIVITGPFDGNASNTTITAAAPRTNVPAGFRSLAESPRQTVVENSGDVTGPIQITVKEGDKQATGTFRNVGVTLSAPKTSLLKGETTPLKVEVSGLQGITEPVPLNLTKGGVVNMQGGDVQTMSIKPAEVQSNGTFTTTRTITGVQPGAWNATATVVVYDVCLEDDGDPLRVLLFMTSTGDFRFCPGNGSGGGPTLTPLSSTDFTGGISIQAGNGLDVVTRNGATTAADFKFNGGNIKLQSDDVSHNGSATVQTKKQTFIITDRDTRNNTCTCQ